MAEINVCFEQLIQFLVAKGEKLTCIHKHSLKVQGDRTVNMHTLWQWAWSIKEFKEEKQNFMSNSIVVALSQHLCLKTSTKLMNWYKVTVTW